MALYIIRVQVKNEKARRMIKKLVDEKEAFIKSLPPMSSEQFEERFLSKKKLA